MTKLIIENTYRAEETSIGFTSEVPVIRVIYFEEDENGVHYVQGITEYDVEYNTAAYIALHGVNWFADFDLIEFHDTHEGKFAEIARNDMAENFTAARFTSFMLHMMYAHAYGYTDLSGQITKEFDGENLFVAYRAQPECDHLAYIEAGQNRL